MSDGEGSVLVVSQFTLLADCSKRRHPNFQKAVKHEEAFRLYKLFAIVILKFAIACEKGPFQTHMEVSLCNDGPVTIVLESRS